MYYFCILCKSVQMHNWIILYFSVSLLAAILTNHSQNINFNSIGPEHIEEIRIQGAVLAEQII
jgi:hypothetical protein